MIKLVNVRSFIHIDLHDQKIFENRDLEPRNIFRLINCIDKYGRNK